MTTPSILSQKSLRITLYSGIALVVISMLFLGRDLATSPLLVQMAYTVFTPALFYGVGALVYRYLNAPLAAPGIVATGAWLVVVELIHFHSAALPDFARAYYWLGASLVATVIVTRTAYRARIWLLVPLVPLTQANAAWAVMDATGMGLAWWPAFTFLLVLAWWEAPRVDNEWRGVYRFSAVLMEVFLLVFSYWLPAKTQYSMPATWGACALLVALLSLRHSLASLGPLAITLLALAAAWGLPVLWWPATWLVIAAGTLIFTEVLARYDDADRKLALELSTALALVLSGVAALLAEAGPLFGAASASSLTVLVLAGSGALLILTGIRRGLITAEHAGLWLIAAGWAELYRVAYGDARIFGIWLGLLAAIALLVERFLLTLQRQKRKTVQSVRTVMADWPLADLAVGLSVLISVWIGFTALHTVNTEPLIVVAATGIVVGIWLAAGLLYRLPVLMHVALWVAPLPYALALIIALPFARTLPVLGLTWQALALVYLVLGHTLHRMRPALQAPFFVAGYGMLGVGVAAMLGNPGLLIAGLTVIILVCFVTSVTVFLGGHPAWDVLVAWLVSPEDRPYAHAHVRHIFMFLTAWLLAIWLQIMLGLTAFSTAQQGIVVVGLASAWIVGGRLLGRLPDVAGWPVYAAGWFLWLIGLVQVFFYPSEAIITAIIGLALSAEAICRSRVYQWMPVFILQILFSVLQIAYTLVLPAHGLLMAVAVGLGIVGMWADRPRKQPGAHRAGQITALMGAGFAGLIWLLHMNPITTWGLVALALAALIVYRRWEFLLALLCTLIGEIALLDLIGHWRVLVKLGALQLVIGSVLVAVLRPRGYRTLRSVLVDTQDWASPFLWLGALTGAAGLLVSMQTAEYCAVGIAWAGLAIITGILVSWLHVVRGPYLVVGLGGGVLLTMTRVITTLPFDAMHNAIARFGAGLALLAFLTQLPALSAVQRAVPFRHARWFAWWVRPLVRTSVFLWGVGCLVLLQAYTFYTPDMGWLMIAVVWLGATSGAVYGRTGRVHWLLLALGFAWITWAGVLHMLGLSGAQWHTIPLGIVLLASAVWIERLDWSFTEIAGVGVMLLGGARDIVAAGTMLSFAMPVMILQLAGLLLYGYIQRRIVPFGSVIVLALGGAVIGLLWINPWFVPLAGGVMLLTGALILEVQREWVVGQITFWRARFYLDWEEKDHLSLYDWYREELGDTVEVPEKHAPASR